MQDHFWEERGVAYRTNRFDPSRQTLVFIHGLGATCSTWAAFERALESNYNILTCDLRGHGLSRRYNNFEEYAPERLVEDLHALLQAMKISSCALISTSFGTLIALLFIRRHPEMVRLNFLLSPLYRHQSPNVGGTKSNAPLWARMLGLMPLRHANGKRMDYSRYEHMEDLDWGRILSEVRNMSVRVYLFYLYHLNTFSNYAQWSEIGVPTTIMHGTKDSFSPYSSAVELSKVIPRATLVTLEGSNHLAIINNGSEILTQLKNEL